MDRNCDAQTFEFKEKPSEAEDIFSRLFPIHKACRDGDVVYLSQLIAESAPDHLIIEDQFKGWTPMHWAAYFGKRECLRGLVRYGVNVNVMTSKFRQTPLHVAAFGGQADILHDLLTFGADFDARDYLGESALHKAARIGNAECIRKLACSGTTIPAFSQSGQLDFDIAHDQSMENCAQMLLAAKQLHTQGFFSNDNLSIKNGTSGLPMSNINGHSKGLSGYEDKSVHRKRTHEDISEPITKRVRTDCYQTNYQLKFEDRSCSSVLNPTMTRLLAESETDNITQNQYCTTHLNDSLPSSRLKKTDSFRDDVMSSWSFPQYEDEVFTDTELPFGCGSASIARACNGDDMMCELAMETEACGSQTSHGKNQQSDFVTSAEKYVLNLQGKSTNENSSNNVSLQANGFQKSDYVPLAMENLSPNNPNVAVEAQSVPEVKKSFLEETVFDVAISDESSPNSHQYFRAYQIPESHKHSVYAEYLIERQLQMSGEQ